MIAAIEAFAEVVAVLIQINVITIVTVGCILIGVRIFIAEARTILSVGLSGANASLIAVVHSLPEHIGAILIRLVVSTATRVTIVRSRIFVGARVLEIYLVLTQALQILLLKTQVRLTLLLLQ